MTTPYLQVSRDAARALEEFSDEFRSALALAEDFPLWATAYGRFRSSNALKSTWPIPVDAAGYKEFNGDMKYRTLYARSASMIMKPWQDGVEEFASVIEAPDFLDWSGAPARMATEWRRLPNIMVADMLATSSLDGPLLDFYRDADSNTASTRRLFAADHPFNIFKTSLGDFDNRLTTTEADILSGAFFDDAQDHFAQIMGPNGRPLGLKMIGGRCLVPHTRANLFRRALTFDTIVQSVNAAGAINPGSGAVAAVTQNNINKGSVSYDIAEELEDQDHFYIFGAGADPGNVPWVVQQESSPEEIVNDKTSQRYRDTGKVSVGSRGQANVAALLPHRIARVEITA